MTKLTDTQTIILSAGVQGPASIALPIPKGLAGAAPKLAVSKMSERGCLQEVEAHTRRNEPLCRETDNGHGTVLVVPDSGLLAVDAILISFERNRYSVPASFAKLSHSRWKAHGKVSVCLGSKLSGSRSILFLAPLVNSYPQIYPSANSLEVARKLAAELHRNPLSKSLPAAIGPDWATRLASISDFAADPKTIRIAAVERHVEAVLSRWKVLFDTIETNPHMPEQCLAVIVEEDATLVFAGAGSGKASVITAKTAWVIQVRIRVPDEILIRAFGRGAAKEMSERIEARYGVRIEARTCHALSYNKIGAVEGESLTGGTCFG